jgi:hypothetical protein
MPSSSATLGYQGVGGLVALAAVGLRGQVGAVGSSSRSQPDARQHLVPCAVLGRGRCDTSEAQPDNFLGFGRGARAVETAQ